jgi:hypothetical protein
MGGRMVDEFFAKSDLPLCEDVREMMITLAKVGFKMYLGISCDLDILKYDPKMQSGKSEFILKFGSNAFMEYVDIAEGFEKLGYQNVILGMIKGSLNAVKS